MVFVVADSGPTAAGERAGRRPDGDQVPQRRRRPVGGRARCCPRRRSLPLRRPALHRSAVRRTMAAILENYQQPDGSASIPDAIVSYLRSRRWTRTEGPRCNAGRLWFSRQVLRIRRDDSVVSGAWTSATTVATCSPGLYRPDRPLGRARTKPVLQSAFRGTGQLLDERLRQALADDRPQRQDRRVTHTHLGGNALVEW